MADLEITSGDSTLVTIEVPGPAGSTPTVAVGTVSTVASGQPATVTNVGSPTAAILNFAIPQGIPGNGTGGTADHGLLIGLSDDDHPQYFNQTRGDARYSLTAHTHTLTKSSVGLGNVDNTSDANKPISTATQAALNDKANTTHTHVVSSITATGTRDATTYLRGDGTWSTPAGGGGGASDHGELTGLADDDHPQYLNLARGDARYIQTTDSRLFDARTPLTHNHGIADINTTGTRSNTTFLRGDGFWAVPPGGGEGTSDHGSLLGLLDDDHPQYYNQIRGDARYSQVGHGHVSANITDLTETVQDTIASSLVQGDNISIVYNDTAGTTTISSDVTGLTEVTVADLPSGSTLTVLKAGGTWPARPTSRSDIIVAWKGADPSPTIIASGNAGMLDGIDYRLVTTS